MGTRKQDNENHGPDFPFPISHFQGNSAPRRHVADVASGALGEEDLLDLRGLPSNVPIFRIDDSRFLAFQIPY